MRSLQLTSVADCFIEQRKFYSAVPKQCRDFPQEDLKMPKQRLILLHGPASSPEAMGTAAKVWHRCRCAKTDGGAPMTQVDDLSRSLIAFEQNSTMVVVLEMSQSSWLAAGVVPGIERRPLKKLDPDPTALLRLVEGWRDHAMKVGRMITRIVLAFEAGRDGFWLARWL